MKKVGPANTVTITADGKGLADNELEVNVVLRGTPQAVIFALAHGFPREALEAMRDAFDEELRKQKDLEPR